MKEASASVTLLSLSQSVEASTFDISPASTPPPSVFHQPSNISPPGVSHTLHLTPRGVLAHVVIAPLCPQPRRGMVDIQHTLRHKSLGLHSSSLVTINRLWGGIARALDGSVGAPITRVSYRKGAKFQFSPRYFDWLSFTTWQSFQSYVANSRIWLSLNMLGRCSKGDKQLPGL